MAKQTKTTGEQVIVTDGIMPTLFPAEGMEITMKPDERRVVVSCKEATPYGGAVRMINSAVGHFRVAPILGLDGQLQYVLTDGFVQRLFPAEGIEARVNVNGRRLALVPKDGCSPAYADALKMLALALSNGTIQVDPIVDPAFPFKPYDPGRVVYQRPTRPGEPEPAAVPPGQLRDTI